MNRTGRPLRFLLMVGLSWAGMRALLLWPEMTVIPVAIGGLQAPTVRQAPPAVGRDKAAPAPARQALVANVVPTFPLSPASSPRSALVDRLAFSRAPPAAPPPPLSPMLVAETSPTASMQSRAPSRWSGDAWLLARGGGVVSAPGAMLGGAQAGARLRIRLESTNRLGGYARVATPLSGRGRDAAVGIEWQPTRLPVRLFAEQRWQVDNGTGGPAAGVVGGVGPVALPIGFSLEGYGAAGLVTGRAGQRFAEGAVRVARPAVNLLGLSLNAGIGAWGGAQRDAARLDVGPSVSFALPVGDRPIRLQVDWRQRVAGDARPGSGPTLTLATGF